jgi:branched-chain amino acid aminotransferase
VAKIEVPTNKINFFIKLIFLMKYNIRVYKTKKSNLSKVDFNNIPFGQTYSDHMFVADYENGQWLNLQIRPVSNLSFHPGLMALHYGQSLFEGMKASKLMDGTPLLMRPEMHARRMNHSCERLCMPAIPEELFVQALEKLVLLDKDWIPQTPDASLYIRPFMFATDETLGVRPSNTYKFIILTGPVGPYYAKPVKLWVEQKFVRAVKGGTGEAKAAGNYAGSLYPAKLAAERGYDQIIWTDAHEHKYLHEAGTMNLFFVIDGKAITPSTDGEILKGITRDCFLHILKSKGIPHEVRPIHIDELVNAYKNGKLQAAFGAGTAAVVSPVSEITYNDLRMTLPPIDAKGIPALLKAEIEGLRNGSIKDTYGWMRPLVAAQPAPVAVTKKKKVLDLEPA